MSSALPAVVQPPDSPALVRALPYLASGISIIFSSVLALFRATLAVLSFIAKVIAHPIVFLSPFPVLLYIATPLIVFVQILLEVVVYSPYRAVLFVSNVFYPAYVFVGVACITGAVLGLSGRLAVLGVLYAFNGPAQSPPQRLVDAREEKLRRIP
ncbi:hypothetical protein B0H11DRAFT_503388 [Mycena galericulata]|nr:hypothetical protein B0H11DRAFT_503388 [Mycena galericulata]